MKRTVNEKQTPARLSPADMAHGLPCCCAVHSVDTHNNFKSSSLGHGIVLHGGKPYAHTPSLEPDGSAQFDCGIRFSQGLLIIIDGCALQIVARTTSAPTIILHKKRNQ